VHWIGTGLSTGASGLRVLADSASQLLLWGRTAGRAEHRIDQFGLSGRVRARAYDVAAVAEEVRAGDVVVSMLPGTEHAKLLRLCVEHRAHFACTSYVSEPIMAESAEAKDAGLVVLTEAGLDPGIDHLFADLLVAKARAAAGSEPAGAEFTSYCGGIPAVPNEFRYRFSWAPRGVLTALLAPARYVEGGAERTVERPWEATRSHVLNGETFEVYPNRDSLPYVDQYAIPDSWRLNTFVRGTLRLAGWQAAWADVFAELVNGDRQRIAALADELAARYPTTEADRDRVVLAVALRVGAWSGQYLLDVTGSASESAMARCVSLPLSYGITQILSGRMPAGLRQAAQDAEAAQEWLTFLGENGIPCRFTESRAQVP
jgi:saccharopine dehydrogenase (NADP+, L-glutamate forming)